MTEEASPDDLGKRSAVADDGDALTGGGAEAAEAQLGERGGGNEGSATADMGGGAVGEPIWHDADYIGGSYEAHVAVVIAVVLAAIILCLLLVCFCSFLSKRMKKKRSGAALCGTNGFGLKKNTGYFKEKMCGTSKPVRNPTPGAKYLKKSPSPDGVKAPPGYPVEETSTRRTHHAHPPPVPEAVAYIADEVSIDSRRDSSISYDSELALKNSAANGSVAAAVPTNRDDVSDTCNDDKGQLGTLHCTARYDFDKSALVVTVNRCKNLPAKDASAKSSDPYVKLQLLPDKQHKVKTRVMRRTLNPIYDEDFTFYGVNFDQLPDLTLHFVVLSFDRYSRDDVIGEVMVELNNIDFGTSVDNVRAPISISKEIMPRSFKLKSQGRGEILVSLCYQPAANRVTAVVLKARNLPKMDVTGLSDPYVKIYMLCNEQRTGTKKKTHVKKKTLNPVFNESFVFDLPQHLEGVDDGGSGGSEGGAQTIKNISFEFQLLDWDRVTKNEVIGRLELGGPSCSGTALHHWNEVISSPRRQIAEWHKLTE